MPYGWLFPPCPGGCLDTQPAQWVTQLNWDEFSLVSELLLINFTDLSLDHISTAKKLLWSSLYSWCCIRGQRIKDCQCQARLWDGQSQLNVMWLWDWPVWTRMMVQLGAKFFVKFDWLEKSDTYYKPIIFIVVFRAKHFCNRSRAVINHNSEFKYLRACSSHPLELLRTWLKNWSERNYTIFYNSSSHSLHNIKNYQQASNSNF